MSDTEIKGEPWERTSAIRMVHETGPNYVECYIEQLWVSYAGKQEWRRIDIVERSK